MEAGKETTDGETKGERNHARDGEADLSRKSEQYSTSGGKRASKHAGQSVRELASLPCGPHCRFLSGRTLDLYPATHYKSSKFTSPESPLPENEEDLESTEPRAARHSHFLTFTPSHDCTARRDPDFDGTSVTPTLETPSIAGASTGRIKRAIGFIRSSKATRRSTVNARIGGVARKNYLQRMNTLLLVLLVLLLLGGGGFYIGGPVVGGSTLGLILLVCLIIYLTGGFRTRM